MLFQKRFIFYLVFNHLNIIPSHVCYLYKYIIYTTMYIMAFCIDWLLNFMIVCLGVLFETLLSSESCNHILSSHFDIRSLYIYKYIYTKSNMYLHSAQFTQNKKKKTLIFCVHMAWIKIYLEKNGVYWNINP